MFIGLPYLYRDFFLSIFFLAMYLCKWSNVNNPRILFYWRIFQPIFVATQSTVS
jgi:hypothetical protein